jgi:hypothetical protein
MEGKKKKKKLSIFVKCIYFSKSGAHKYSYKFKFVLKNLKLLTRLVGRLIN